MAREAPLLDALAKAKHYADLGSLILEQLAFAQFLDSGNLARHLLRVRTIYHARRDALVAALARHAPALLVRGVAAGLHAVVQLPAGVDERVVVAAAEQPGVGAYGVSDFHALGGLHAPALVLGYAAIPEPAIVAGVAILAQVL